MELKGKIIDFLGDSITEGVGVSSSEKRYDRIMLRDCGLAAANNYGVSGSRFAHQHRPSANPRFDLCFCGRAYDLDKNADIIVVYGGVNDYLHGDADFGSYEDLRPTTFCGAVNFLMTKLKELYPGKTIVFMTPAHSNTTFSDKGISPCPDKAADAKPLEYYVNAVVDAGKRHGIPVLDLFHDLGIDSNDPEQKKKYTADGLHFNDAGHIELAAKLTAFIEAL